MNVFVVLTSLIARYFVVDLSFVLYVTVSELFGRGQFVS